MSVQILSVGSKFRGYTVVRSLGMGGMGAVYLVRSANGAEYALKVMLPDAGEAGLAWRRRFKREANFAMTVRHKNLVAVHEAGDDEETGFCYILMDYMPGGSLSERIANEGRLGIRDAVEIAIRIASVLEVAHSVGVIHRDIKPDNIMFDAEGNPRLADLGIAKFNRGENTSMTMKGAMIGTPAYMSPEQMINSHEVDERADIYSLGVVLYEMLAGTRPRANSTAVELIAKAIQGESLPDIRSIRPEISIALSYVISLMTAVKPAQRVASAFEVVRLLCDVAADSGKNGALAKTDGNAANASLDANGLFPQGIRFRGYVVEKLIGKGAMGAVYLVKHEMLNQKYALKVLSKDVAVRQPEYVERFLREARIASQIRHPNLVAVHDVGYDETHDVYYLVMDYVSGSNLRCAIALGGVMDHHEAVGIVACVASALVAGAGLGIVHRDLKPENILLDDKGNVKLVDLGVAKAVGADSLRTMANTVFGTPNYISPEQAIDSSSVDARADIYSLGVILFELLAGKHPYGDGEMSTALKFLLSRETIPDVSRINPKVPSKLAAIVGLMCEKNPDKRISSCAELLKMLRGIGYDVPEASPVVSTADVAEENASVNINEILNRPANNTLSFETKDEEITSFVENLKRRKRRKKIAKNAIVAAVVCAIMCSLGYIFSIFSGDGANPRAVGAATHNGDAPPPVASNLVSQVFKPCAALRKFDPDYDASLRRAKRSGKPVFCLFTGSDWCGFCISLAKDVLARDEFVALATNVYELVVLDFPHDQNSQTEIQRQRYRSLRQRFAPGCGYPTIVLISPDERVLFVNRGYSKSESPEKWFAEFTTAAKKPLEAKSQPLPTAMIPPGSKIVYLDEIARNAKCVDIPEGVERIAKKLGGHYPGTAVETIKIPSSVRHISSHAIVGFWHHLRKIEVASGSPYVVTNGCLVDTRDSSLVFALSGSARIVVPESVKLILDYAFEGNDALEVRLPDGLEKVGDDAFTHCSSLERINIPSTVKRIGSGAFNFCGKLRDVSVSSANKRYRVVNGFLIDGEMDRLLRAWGSDDVMEIPDGVRIIGGYAFTSMESLEVVKIPSSVEIVERSAFGWCRNLMKIMIPREELRSQIVEEIRDYSSPYGNKGERKTRIGVNGSPKLLPSQIIVYGSASVKTNVVEKHNISKKTNYKPCMGLSSSILFPSIHGGRPSLFGGTVPIASP